MLTSFHSPTQAAHVLRDYPLSYPRVACVGHAQKSITDGDKSGFSNLSMDARLRKQVRSGNNGFTRKGLVRRAERTKEALNVLFLRGRAGWCTPLFECDNLLLYTLAPPAHTFLTLTT